MQIHRKKTTSADCSKGKASAFLSVSLFKVMDVSLKINTTISFIHFLKSSQLLYSRELFQGNGCESHNKYYNFLISYSRELSVFIWPFIWSSILGLFTLRFFHLVNFLIELFYWNYCLRFRMEKIKFRAIFLFPGGTGRRWSCRATVRARRRRRGRRLGRRRRWGTSTSRRFAAKAASAPSKTPTSFRVERRHQMTAAPAAVLIRLQLRRCQCQSW